MATPTSQATYTPRQIRRAAKILGSARRMADQAKGASATAGGLDTLLGVLSSARQAGLFTRSPKPDVNTGVR